MTVNPGLASQKPGTLTPGLPSRGMSLTEEWEGLRSRLSDRRARATLSSLMRYRSARRMAPAAVDEAIVDGYMRYRAIWLGARTCLRRTRVLVLRTPSRPAIKIEGVERMTSQFLKFEKSPALGSTAKPSDSMPGTVPPKAPAAPSIGARERRHPRHRAASPTIVLLTPKEAAALLKVSVSWLAKARMRGDGPPFIRLGRSIRYVEATLLQWMRAQQRLSTGHL